MRPTAQKWGNSLAIRIPKVAEEVWPRDKDYAEIEVQEETFVVWLQPRRVYRLKDLVKAMTPRNLRKALVIGEPVGREAL